MVHTQSQMVEADSQSMLLCGQMDAAGEAATASGTKWYKGLFGYEYSSRRPGIRKSDLIESQERPLQSEKYWLSPESHDLV